MTELPIPLALAGAPLRAILHDIPEAELPPQLWPRILASHVQQRRRRRRRYLAGSLALAASVLLAVVLRLGTLIPDATAPTDWQARAQQLERRVLALNLSTADRALTAPEQADLEALDERLQRAYDRGDAYGDITALWQRRCALLDTLLRVHRQPLQLTRI